ncbi:hypothetical protein SEVIR_5G126601v4 [Setaria viridis]
MFLSTVNRREHFANKRFVKSTRSLHRPHFAQKPLTFREINPQPLVVPVIFYEKPPKLSSNQPAVPSPFPPLPGCRRLPAAPRPAPSTRRTAMGRRAGCRRASEVRRRPGGPCHARSGSTSVAGELDVVEKGLRWAKAIAAAADGRPTLGSLRTSPSHPFLLPPVTAPLPPCAPRILGDLFHDRPTSSAARGVLPSLG